MFVFAFNLKEFTPYDCVAGATHAYELISFISRLIYEYVAVPLLSCVTLFGSEVCSTPGSPVLHCLQEFAQNHVHRGDDVIQPSLSLYPLLFLASVFPSIRVFSNKLSLLLYDIYLIFIYRCRYVLPPKFFSVGYTWFPQIIL